MQIYQKTHNKFTVSIGYEVPHFVIMTSACSILDNWCILLCDVDDDNDKKEEKKREKKERKNERKNKRKKERKKERKKKKE